MNRGGLFQDSFRRGLFHRQAYPVENRVRWKGRAPSAVREEYYEEGPRYALARFASARY